MWSLFLFTCAEIVNKLPSFTRALHCSHILDKQMTSNKNFQRGQKLRKDITPNCFS